VHGFHLQQQPQQRRRSIITSRRSSSSISISVGNNDKKEAPTWSSEFMFEDGKGHINPELAQRIYKWEQDQRSSQNLPKFQYSTREGIRWVLDFVKDGDEDLMQEGVIALMQAMTEFERKAPSKISYEAYCKHSIQHALNEYKRTGLRRKAALSVESTVKIDDPLETHYSNQDEWEMREGLMLDNGQGVKTTKKILVEDFLDESVQYEGEDQMWVQQQQVAAPLQHSIPDEEQRQQQEDNDLIQFLGGTKAEAGDDGQGGIHDIDDRFLADMIRYDVDEFLGATLEDLESQVIQMRFGLGDEPMTQKQVAFELDLGVAKVRKIQKQALEKLRNAYTARYAPKGEDEDGHYWEQEDSV
jgi:RNA polymerase sigma factor (sigma-70 family)